MAVDMRNTVIQVNRAAKAINEALTDVLTQQQIRRCDLLILIEKIKLYEDHIDIRFRSEVRQALRLP